MKRKSPLVRNSSETDLNTAMTPMIDVVFLLLVFFVWTASFQLIEYVVPSNTSAQIGTDAADPIDPPPPSDIEDVVVKIQWKPTQQLPQWSVNGKVVTDIGDVGDQLNAIADLGTESKVILDPESVVPLGFVFETYDLAKVAGFEQVSFAVRPK